MGDEEMNDDFFGFSPESFEQFARAIAVAVLGSNLIGFGDGPDGGREAMFDGEVNYKAKGSEDWNGYGVIQAKYKTKTEGTTRDQKWVLDSLNRELELFHTSESRNPKPAYYLLITNVALSSANRGGKAKIDEVFETYSDRLPLRGWAVWDANQLRTYLPKYPEIRNNFLQFFTVGDFLASILDRLNLPSRNLQEVLRTYLIRELRKDTCARLDQTGNKTEWQVPLPRLFFDIPAAQEPTSTTQEERLDQFGKLPTGVLHEMLNDASRKLDPETIQIGATASDGRVRFPARYVLQGGPGSGKSTIGQFLAQIHRAALLERVQSHFLLSDAVDLINQVRQNCTDQDLRWPTAPRYPIRIELIQFAKALAAKDDGVKSFAGYLLRSIRGDHSMDHESLVAFFGSHPSLIILDGLDEVPHTSNRAQVIQTIKNFLDELRGKNADVFLVASTRVQGYQNEFAEDDVAVRFLRPLSRTRALQYVRTYASVRYGVDHPENTERIVKAIEDTETNSITKQLLSTPLQATFLVTVIAAKGSPGANRWSLLKSYYDTIYDRELQRAVPLQYNVLRELPQLIFRLHQIVGFWLQYLGETEPGESTYLLKEIFHKVAETLLTEKGYVGKELKQVTDSLVYASRERLIFLTSRVAGELSFEVRSLQEFMAAECLMTGVSQVVQQRLKKICGSFYWRNTILFAANKCFADSTAEHFQDTICGLPQLLNTEAMNYGLSFKPGAELALDLVLSGATESDPKSTITLTASALERVDIIRETEFWGPNRHRNFRRFRGNYNEKLASIHSKRTNYLFRERIEKGLAHTSTLESVESLTLLSRIDRSQWSWAKTLVKDQFAKRGTDGGIILQHFLNIDLSPELLDAIVEWIFRQKPCDLEPIIDRSRHWVAHLATDLERHLFELFGSTARLSEAVVSCFFSKDFPDVRFGFWMQSVMSKRGEAASKLLSRVSGFHRAWLPLKYSAEFYDKPDFQSLLGVLEKVSVSKGFCRPDPWILGVLPWPIAICLEVAKSKRQLVGLVKRLRAMENHCIPDLHRIEARIRGRSVDPRDMSGSTDPVDVLSGHHEDVVLPIGIFRSDRAIDLEEERAGGFRTKSSRMSFQSPDFFTRINNLAMKELIAEYFLSFNVVALADPESILSCVRSASIGTFIDLDFRREKGVLDTGKWIAICAALGDRGFTISESAMHRLSGAHLSELQREFSGAKVVAGRKVGGISRRRLGILMFLANCAWLGQSLFKIPAKLLSPERFRQTRHQFGALLVRLSSLDFQVSEVGTASEVVRKVLLSPSRVEYAQRLCDVLEFHFCDSEGFTAFVSEVRGLMPESLFFERSRCEGVMRKVFELRPSRLHEVAALRKLWLPDVDNLAQLGPAKGN
jgi:hypothetical protein